MSGNKKGHRSALSTIQGLNNSVQQRLKLFGQICFTSYTNLLVNQLSVVEVEQGRNGAYAEAKETAKEFTDSAKETFNNASGDNKKVLAGVLGIVVGWAGVHKFILGYNKEGGIMLASSIVLYFLTCGIGTLAVAIIGLVEGIIYLTKSDEEFYNTYQAGKKPWF